MPEFGRRLYHLPMRKLVVRQQRTPVDVKLSALGAGELVGSDLRARYEAVFERWSAEMASTGFGGVVLDYDGTVCTTANRYDLPDPDVMFAVGRNQFSGNAKTHKGSKSETRKGNAGGSG